MTQVLYLNDYIVYVQRETLSRGINSSTFCILNDHYKITMKTESVISTLPRNEQKEPAFMCIKVQTIRKNSITQSSSYSTKENRYIRNNSMIYIVMTDKSQLL